MRSFTGRRRRWTRCCARARYGAAAAEGLPVAPRLMAKRRGRGMHAIAGLGCGPDSIWATRCGRGVDAGAAAGDTELLEEVGASGQSLLPGLPPHCPELPDAPTLGLARIV